MFCGIFGKAYRWFRSWCKRDIHNGKYGNFFDDVENGDI